jgi:hypothetical protein
MLSPMFDHVIAANLPRPEALDGDAWAAIRHHVDKLSGACQSGMPMAAVGSAKELVESIARVVLAARGQQAPKNIDFESLLTRAHHELEKPGGDGLSNDTRVRDTASMARKLVTKLGTVRNDYGDGHGRELLPDVPNEVVETYIDGSLLWSRWALRRLHHYIDGDVQALVRDLHNSAFYGGTLARRLDAAGIPSLPEDDQRGVGVAVGQCASDDFVIAWNEGVEPCINSTDTGRWPLAYREGLATGLLLSREGEIRVRWNATSPSAALAVLSPHSHRTKVLADLADKLDGAPWSRYNRAKAETTMAVVSGIGDEWGTESLSELKEAFGPIQLALREALRPHIQT